MLANSQGSIMSEGMSTMDTRDGSHDYSMEEFVRNSLAKILEPFLENLAEIESRCLDLEDGRERADAIMAETNAELERNAVVMRQIKAAQENAETQWQQAIVDQAAEAARKNEMLLQGLQKTNEYADRLFKQGESNGALTTQLHRDVGECDTRLQLAQANLQKTMDTVANITDFSLAKIGADMQELNIMLDNRGTDINELRLDVDKSTNSVQEMHFVVEANRANCTNLLKLHLEIANSSKQLSARVEGLKHQWSIVEAAFQTMRKDQDTIRDVQDHHTAVIHGLQQGCSDQASNIQNVREENLRMDGDVRAMKGDLTEARTSLDRAHDGLNTAIRATNNLHTGFEHLGGSVCNAFQRVGGLEMKHRSLTDGLERTERGFSKLRGEHERTAFGVSSLRKEIGRTSDACAETRTHVDKTVVTVRGMREEMGVTNQAVQKLGQGVEVCHQRFQGMQKGFVATGNNIEKRRTTILSSMSREGCSPMGALPSLGGGSNVSSVRSPSLMDKHSPQEMPEAFSDEANAGLEDIRPNTS